MNNPRLKIGYWISTVAMCGIFLMSATMYLAKYDMVVGFFQELGHPTYLIYPLAIAKILGIIAIVSDKSRWLSEWAYAGFFFDVILATAAHYHAGHGLIGLSFFGIFIVLISRILWPYRTA